MYNCPSCKSIFNIKHSYYSHKSVWDPEALRANGKKGAYVKTKIDNILLCKFCNATFNPESNYKVSKPNVTVDYLEMVDQTHGSIFKNKLNLEIKFLNTLNHEDRMRYLINIITDGTAYIVEISHKKFAYITRMYYSYAMYKNIFPLDYKVISTNSGWVLAPHIEDLQNWKDELKIKANNFLENNIDSINI